MLARAAGGVALSMDAVGEANRLTSRGHSDPTTITDEFRDAYPGGSFSFAALSFSFALLLMGSSCLQVLLPRFPPFPGPAGVARPLAGLMHKGETDFIGFERIVKGQVERPGPVRVLLRLNMVNSMRRVNTSLSASTNWLTLMRL